MCLKYTGSAPTNSPVHQLQSLGVLADQRRFNVFHDVTNVVQGSGHHGRTLRQNLQSTVHAAYSLTPRESR